MDPVCPTCHGRVSPGMKACPSCFTELPWEQPAGETPMVDEPAPERHRGAIALILFIELIAALGVGAWVLEYFLQVVNSEEPPSVGGAVTWVLGCLAVVAYVVVWTALNSRRRLRVAVTLIAWAVGGLAFYAIVALAIWAGAEGPQPL